MQEKNFKEKSPTRSCFLISWMNLKIAHGGWIISFDALSCWTDLNPAFCVILFVLPNFIESFSWSLGLFSYMMLTVVLHVKTHFSSWRVKITCLADHVFTHSQILIGSRYWFTYLPYLLISGGNRLVYMPHIRMVL